MKRYLFINEILYFRHVMKPNKPILRYTFAMGISMMAVIVLSACSTYHKQQKQAERRKKQLEVTQQERYKETEKQYLAATEKHNKKQTKETRRQMKELKRKADEFHGLKKPPFYKRWFNKEYRTTKPRKKEET